MSKLQVLFERVVHSEAEALHHDDQGAWLELLNELDNMHRLPRAAVLQPYTVPQQRALATAMDMACVLVHEDRSEESRAAGFTAVYADMLTLFPQPYEYLDTENAMRAQVKTPGAAQGDGYRYDYHGNRAA